MAEAYSSESELLKLHDHHQGYYSFHDPDFTSATSKEFRKAIEAVNVIRRGSKTKVFDVGFGNGLFLALAKNMGWEVAGIDTCAENVPKASSQLGVSLAQGSFDSFVPNESYDVVSFWDVLEHMSDPNAALRKTINTLVPGGVVIVGIPNDSSAMAKIASLLYRATLGKCVSPVNRTYIWEHVCYFNRTSLKYLFEQHGFVEKVFFLSRTDLAKYTLPFFEKIIVQALLIMGRITRWENRMVAVYQRASGK